MRIADARWVSTVFTLIFNVAPIALLVGRRLKSLHSRTEILILTMHEDEELLTEAVLGGIRGLLFKSDARKHLIAAIEALLERRPYFTSVVLEKLLHDYRVGKQHKSETLLTAREQCVVQLIAEGNTGRMPAAPAFNVWIG